MCVIVTYVILHTNDNIKLIVYYIKLTKKIYIYKYVYIYI